MRPAVSVLLPARNAGSTVERAVRSILDGSWSDLELIAVDDGSTDDTLTRLRHLAVGEPRLKVLTTSGEGLVPALNLALRHAQAEDFIARMDADDESLPMRLEKSIATLLRLPALAGVGTQVALFREDQPVSPNLQRFATWLNSLTSAQVLRDERFIESPLCHPSVTLRRYALEAVGGWEDGDFPEDWQLWLKLLDKGFALACVGEVLHRWRDHEHRATRVDPRYRHAAHHALKAQFLAPLLMPNSNTRTFVWGAGEVGLQMLRQLRSRGVQVCALVDVDPRKIGQRIDEVTVVEHHQLPAPLGFKLVAAVGAKGAREEIRAFLQTRGWREGVDFWCVA
ncbi:MAG: glycosyltransferase [Myxococcaceae bacterium]|nr:glycosyltransferase [Myxococcaceae bacterium]